MQWRVCVNTICQRVAQNAAVKGFYVFYAERQVQPCRYITPYIQFIATRVLNENQAIRGIPKPARYGYYQEEIDAEYSESRWRRARCMWVLNMQCDMAGTVARCGTGRINNARWRTSRVGCKTRPWWGRPRHAAASRRPGRSLCACFPGRQCCSL